MTTEATTDQGVAEVSESEMDTGVEDTGAEEVSEGEVETEEVEAGSEEGESEEKAGDGINDEEAKFEVVVDGTPISLTRDELIKGFQQGASSHERYRKAAEMRKEAESTREALMKDPIAAFLKAGGDEAALRDLTETYLYGQIQRDKMSPEERELEELKQYKEQVERQQQEHAEAKKAEMQAAQTKKYEEEYVTSFTKAFESAGVKATEQAMSRVAQIQLSALEAGYEIPIDMVVSQYKDEQTELINGYLSSLDADSISSVIGKERMKEIRKKELAGAKNPKARKSKPETENTQSTAEDTRSMME